MILTLKQISVLLLVSLFLGSTIVWGLKEIILTEPSVLFTKAEASEGPLELIVTLDKRDYKVGEGIDLTIQIVNVGNSTIELVYGTPFVCPPIRFAVYDQEGNITYGSGTYVQATIVLSYNKTLEPNHILGIVKLWKQTSMDGEQVAPGEYFITTEIIPNALYVYGYINGTRTSYGAIYIKTPSITVTISN